jgi:hypothetical protein
LLACAVVSLTTIATEPAEQMSVQAAVELYPSGEWRRAVQGLDSKTLTVGQLIQELEGWIASAGSAEESRRRVLAGAFALDAVWLAAGSRRNDGWLPNAEARGFDGQRQPIGSRTAQGVVASWASRQIPGGTADATERWLWLAAIGVAEDGSAWFTLEDEILPRARQRLPNDARVRLAVVLARLHTDLEMRRWAGPMRRNDVLGDEYFPARVARRIPAAIEALETLLGDVSLAGEVELRIGHLELRRRNWTNALARFEAARGKTSEQLLRAIADYMAGWAHEQLGHPDEAIGAYRRALLHYPTMRNLATRVSALLFLRDARAEAFAIIDRALSAQSNPLDLMISLERGDGRFVADWLETVRGALQERPSY